MKETNKQRYKSVIINLKELLRKKTEISKLHDLKNEYNNCFNTTGKTISMDLLRAAIKYSQGEIHKNSEGDYVAGNVEDYNGINGRAIVDLRKLQRDYCVFPNPYIYRINENTLMVQVKMKYADRVKYLIDKAFTKRYIYDSILHGNQLIIMLLSEEESQKCNCGREGKTCRTDKFSEITLEKEKRGNPFLKEAASEEILSCDQIYEMLLGITKIELDENKK
ncbi:MAG: hypothetical protein PUF80_06340 [Firmicutes bacterium]|nr:hypothetical protein [Bacillota bacterium]